MKILEVEVKDVVLKDAKTCRLLFQHRYLSELIDLNDHQTRVNKYEIPCSTIKNGKEIIIISLIAYDENNIEKTIGTQVLEVASKVKNHSRIDEEVVFQTSTDKAIVLIHYMVKNMSIIETLQRYNDQSGCGFGWNICALFLPISDRSSTHSEDSNLKLRLYDQSNGALLASGKISSKSTSYFIPMIYALPSVSAVGNPRLPVELEVLNSRNRIIQRLKVREEGPALYCIRNGEVVAYISIQSLLNKERLTTIVHSVTVYDERHGKYIHGNSKMTNRDQIYSLFLLPEEDNDSTAIDLAVQGIVDLSRNSKDNAIGPKDGFYIFAESKYSANIVPSPRSSDPISHHVGLFTIQKSATSDKLAFRTALVKSQVTKPAVNSITDPESYVETPGDELIHRIENDIADYLADSNHSIESYQLASGILQEISRDVNPISKAVTVVLQGQIHSPTAFAETGSSGIFTVGMHITVAIPISSAMTTVESLPPAVLADISSAIPIVPQTSPSRLMESPRPGFAVSDLDVAPEADVSLENSDQSSLVTDAHSRNIINDLIESIVDRIEKQSAEDVEGDTEQLPNDSSFMEPSFAIAGDQDHSEGYAIASDISSPAKWMNDSDRDNLLRLIEKLQHEISDRDRTIAQLQFENNNQAEGIRSCSTDIRAMKISHDKLKVANHELIKRNDEYEREKAATYKMTEEVLKLPSSLNKVPASIYQSMITEIVTRFQTLTKQYQEVTDQLKQYQRRELDHQQLVEQHQRLLRAHQQQSSILQQLQQEQTMTQKYIQTIQTQEQLIQKLQLMLEKKILKKRDSSPRPQLVLSPRNDEPNSQMPTSSDDAVANLEAEVTMRDIRIEALNEQLFTSTKKYAAEVANQRIRIIELETALEKFATPSPRKGLNDESQYLVSSPLPTGTAINAVNALRKQNFDSP